MSRIVIVQTDRPHIIHIRRSSCVSLNLVVFTCEKVPNGRLLLLAHFFLEMPITCA